MANLFSKYRCSLSFRDAATLSNVSANWVVVYNLKGSGNVFLSITVKQVLRTTSRNIVELLLDC